MKIRLVSPSLDHKEQNCFWPSFLAQLCLCTIGLSFLNIEAEFLFTHAIIL